MITCIVITCILYEVCDIYLSSLKTACLQRIWSCKGFWSFQERPHSEVTEGKWNLVHSEIRL